jgi:hypothetical protein
VRHFHAKHGYANPLAGNGGLESHGNLAGKCPKAFISSLVKVEDIVVFHVLRDYQGVTGGQGGYIQECVEVIGLCALVGRDFSGGDFCEYCSHLKGKFP